MASDFKVQRLSDEFGQYLLVIKCSGCAHERRAYPNLLAHLCGWDVTLADLQKRLRCSKCGEEVLSHSSNRDSKATRCALGALAFHRILQTNVSYELADGVSRACRSSVEGPCIKS